MDFVNILEYTGWGQVLRLSDLMQYFNVTICVYTLSLDQLGEDRLAEIDVDKSKFDNILTLLVNDWT